MGKDIKDRYVSIHITNAGIECIFISVYLFITYIHTYIHNTT